MNALLRRSAAVVIAMTACGGDDATEQAAPPFAAPASCPPGEMPLEGGACQPAGLAPNPGACPPGEVLVSGACEPAGVPASACAEGFEADGANGCAPVLPSGACAPATMAVPGDAACHAAAACAAGAWGDIPVGADTEYVDASFAGASDGSPSSPWKTIAQAIAAAAPGAVVAIAAGTYAEDLVADRSVRLWGRCPELVSVVGSGSVPATLYIHAANVEVHALAITGAARGVELSSAAESILDGVWIHDAGDLGLYAYPSASPTNVTVRDALIENASGVGLLGEGADIVAERVEIRGTQPRADGTLGRGVVVEYDTAMNARARLSMKTSVVSDSREMGIAIGSSDATIVGSVVRRTLPSAGTGQAGYGILATNEIVVSERSSLALTGSLVADVHDVGVWVGGSDATIDTTVVSATHSNGAAQSGRGLHFTDAGGGQRASVAVARSSVVDSDAAGVVTFASDVSLDATLVDAGAGPTSMGRGISVGPSAGGDRSSIAIRGSRIAHSWGSGVEVFGSDATLEDVAVSHTVADATDLGYAIAIGSDKPTMQRGRGTLTRVTVEDSIDMGILVQSADVVGDGVAVRRTHPVASTGFFGRGLVINDDATLKRSAVSLRASLFEDNHEASILAAGSDVLLEGVLVRATQWSAGQYADFGFGVAVQDGQEPASLVMRWCVVEDSGGLGVVATNSDATIEASVISDTRPAADGKLGDGLAVTAVSGAASAKVIGSLVRGNGRVGISNFGGALTLGTTRLECNPIQLDGEIVTTEPSFDDLGGNTCSCASDAITCAVQTAHLEAPPSL